MADITPVSWKKFEKFILFIGCVLVRKRGIIGFTVKPDLKDQ